MGLGLGLICSPVQSSPYFELIGLCCAVLCCAVLCCAVLCCVSWNVSFFGNPDELKQMSQTYSNSPINIHY